MYYNLFEREDGKRARVTDSYEYLNPTNFGQDVLFLIREHKDYSFPNDLDFDFNEDVYQKYGDEYDIYPLNCYIHDNVHLYIKWTKITEMYDTSRDVGYALCLKGSADEKEVKYQIDRLNSILNWEVYDVVFEEEVEWTNPTYWKMTTYEMCDSVCWLIGLEAVQDIINMFKDGKY